METVLAILSGLMVAGSIYLMLCRDLVRFIFGLVLASNAANLVNPQRFILGGGVTKAGERYWKVVRRVARETAMPEVHFDVVPAALGDDAPLWGAVVLAEDCLAQIDQFH